MNRHFLYVLCVLFAVAAPASPQQVEWKDPSPHATRFVTGEDGVQLEVLDWGGSGQALVLLAGLGDTAHAFDEFTPMLAAKYRVLGVTRPRRPFATSERRARDPNQLEGSSRTPATS